MSNGAITTRSSGILAQHRRMRRSSVRPTLIGPRVCSPTPGKRRVNTHTCASGRALPSCSRGSRRLAHFFRQSFDQQTVRARLNFAAESDSLASAGFRCTHFVTPGHSGRMRQVIARTTVCRSVRLNRSARAHASPGEAILTRAKTRAVQLPSYRDASRPECSPRCLCESGSFLVTGRSVRRVCLARDAEGQERARSAYTGSFLVLSRPLRRSHFSEMLRNCREEFGHREILYFKMR